MELLSSLWIYLTHLGKSWYGMVAIASTVITFANVFGVEFLLPLNVWVGAWVASIFLAGFLTWREDFKEYLNSDLALYIRGSRCHIMGNWLDTDNSTLSLNSTITLGFSADFTLENHSQRGVHVRLSIDEVNADWDLIPDMDRVKENMRDNVFSSGGQIENPVSLIASELKDSLWLSNVGIPFSFPNDENEMEYLGSLSKLTIIVSAEVAGHKKKSKLVKCDVSSILDAIDDKLKTVAENDRVLSRQAVDFAIKYGMVKKSKTNSNLIG